MAFQHRIEQIPVLKNLLIWLTLSAIIGGISGSFSAFFLYSLHWATHFRTEHLWLIWLLPAGGLLVGLLYHYFGKDVVKGNNQIIEEYHKPTKIIPFKMAPLVLFGTVVTHFFGGSIGREGTAVQMGSAVSDQFSRFFKNDHFNRQILLVIGISAGFASVFGTPLAGTVFALEVLLIGKMRFEALLPCILTASIADWVCKTWGVPHTHYHIPFVPELDIWGILWAILAGIFFGLGGMAFSQSCHFFGKVFKSKITFPPLRPFVGGAIFALVVMGLVTFVPQMNVLNYIGLGVPTIKDAFVHMHPVYGFAIKILFTTFCIGAGFKGGEVTPLFFVGATLGNVLALFIPLPMALLAGMGFVAVFSGATNTPIACTIMGIELFGADCGIYVGIACFTAYAFSGHTSIYASQLIGVPKHPIFSSFTHKSIGKKHE